MSRNLVRVFLCLAFLVPSALAVGAEPESPFIDDAEEYRVIAALLFPAEPEIPEAIQNDPQRRALSLAERPRLDGLGLGAAFMTIQETTTQGQKMRSWADGRDAALVEDYNRKNEMPARLVAEKLLAHLQKGQDVRLITSQDMRALFQQGGGWEEHHRRSPLGNGITSLSRVGFDPSRTRAVVSVRHQADYEMGIGYRVYLEKSAATGRWLVTGADLTYRS